MILEWALEWCWQNREQADSWRGRIMAALYGVEVCSHYGCDPIGAWRNIASILFEPKDKP